MNKIEKLARKIHLPYIASNYNDEIDYAIANNLSYSDFLEHLLTREDELRLQNGLKKRLKTAKFPYMKTMEELDISCYSNEVAKRIQELQKLNFISKGQNVILIGNPGLGKTHISIALGVLACMNKNKVLFVSAPNLVIELKEEASLHQLHKFKNNFMKYDLVIIDELGYVSFDKEGSELLFNLLSTRVEAKKSTIISSNLTFNKWKDVFNDPILTAAMVDRLARMAYVLPITGESYRLRETKEWLEEQNNS